MEYLVILHHFYRTISYILPTLRTNIFLACQPPVSGGVSRSDLIILPSILPSAVHTRQHAQNNVSGWSVDEINAQLCDLGDGLCRSRERNNRKDILVRKC